MNSSVSQRPAAPIIKPAPVNKNGRIPSTRAISNTVSASPASIKPVAVKTERVRRIGVRPMGERERSLSLSLHLNSIKKSADKARSVAFGQRFAKKDSARLKSRNARYFERFVECPYFAGDVSDGCSARALDRSFIRSATDAVI